MKQINPTKHTANNTTHAMTMTRIVLACALFWYCWLYVSCAVCCSLAGSRLASGAKTSFLSPSTDFEVGGGHGSTSIVATATPFKPAGPPHVAFSFESVISWLWYQSRKGSISQLHFNGLSPRKSSSILLMLWEWFEMVSIRLLYKSNCTSPRIGENARSPMTEISLYASRRTRRLMRPLNASASIVLMLLLIKFKCRRVERSLKVLLRKIVSRLCVIWKYLNLSNPERSPFGISSNSFSLKKSVSNLRSPVKACPSIKLMRLLLRYNCSRLGTPVNVPLRMVSRLFDCR